MNVVGPKRYAKAAKAFAQLLCIDDRDFFLKIDFKKKRSTGACRRLGPASFLIKIGDKSIVDPPEAILAHEMVHLRQYLTGELKDVTVWQGTQYEMDGSLDYYEQPWEIDAFGRQVGLYEKYLTRRYSKK